MSINSRVFIGMMIFFASFQLYMARSNFSMAILAMMKSDEDAQVKNYGKRFDWSKKQEGELQGAYFWGFLFTSLPGGFLAHYFGPKKVCFISMLLSTIFTILSPMAANISYTMIYTARFLIGFVGGPLLPCLHHLIANWAPPVEKGKFIILIEGTAVAIIVTWQMVGALTEAMGYAWGAFYIPAILMLLMIAGWMFLIYDSPEKHPRISAEEKEYISSSLAGSITNSVGLPPIKAIFTSIPFLALICLHYGAHWMLFLYITSIPKFMKEVLNFDLSSAGFLSSLPTIARFGTSLIFAPLGDFLRRRELMTVTHIRKYFTMTSHIIPGVLIIVMGFVDDAYISVAILTLLYGFNGSSTVTNMQNCQDLAPNYAGTLYGIMNTFTTTAGFIAPMVVAHFTEDDNSLGSWKNVFVVTACIFFFTAITFVIFGSGEIQPWNDVQKLKKVNEEEDTDDTPTFERSTLEQNQA
ncbi:sialin-like [Phlebotomus argentipes]|uniref:sialin-like n=1 Tax=Phlebotomus argentipes TaxID=94469 RepID=UPI0028930153|nr:sialin-like [Phlebotomus argentipes]